MGENNKLRGVVKRTCRRDACLPPLNQVFLVLPGRRGAAFLIASPRINTRAKRANEREDFSVRVVSEVKVKDILGADTRLRRRIIAIITVITID